LAFEDSIPGFNESSGYSDDDEGLPGYLVYKGAKVVETDEDCDLERDMHVNWVTRPSDLNQKCKMYAYYGNGPETGYTYNSFCLFVEVGMPGQRSLRPKLEKPSDNSDHDAKSPDRYGDVVAFTDSQD
jgi:hypothetical protein